MYLFSQIYQWLFFSLFQLNIPFINFYTDRISELNSYLALRLLLYNTKSFIFLLHQSLISYGHFQIQFYARVVRMTCRIYTNWAVHVRGQMQLRVSSLVPLHRPLWRFLCTFVTVIYDCLHFVFVSNHLLYLFDIFLLLPF